MLKADYGQTDTRPLKLSGKFVLHIELCKNIHMATNLAIDDGLLEEARKVGGHRTKKATVTEALEEYVQRRKQEKVIKLFGNIDFDPKYDYKKQRQRS